MRNQSTTEHGAPHPVTDGGARVPHVRAALVDRCRARFPVLMMSLSSPFIWLAFALAILGGLVLSEPVEWVRRDFERETLRSFLGGHYVASGFRWTLFFAGILTGLGLLRVHRNTTLSAAGLYRTLGATAVLMVFVSGAFAASFAGGLALRSRTGVVQALCHERLPPGISPPESGWLITLHGQPFLACGNAGQYRLEAHASSASGTSGLPTYEIDVARLNDEREYDARWMRAQYASRSLWSGLPNANQFVHSSLRFGGLVSAVFLLDVFLSRRGKRFRRGPVPLSLLIVPATLLLLYGPDVGPDYRGFVYAVISGALALQLHVLRQWPQRSHLDNAILGTLTLAYGVALLPELLLFGVERMFPPVTRYLTRGAAEVVPIVVLLLLVPPATRMRV